MYKDNIRRQHEDDVTKKIKLSLLKKQRSKIFPNSYVRVKVDIDILSHLDEMIEKFVSPDT